MKKFFTKLTALCLVLLMMAIVGCGNKNDNSPTATTGSVLGDATGLNQTVTDNDTTVTLSVKTPQEAMNTFYSIPEMNFEARSRAMKVWLGVFNKEFAAAETSPELEKLGNFIPSGQEDLQKKFISKRESVWRNEVNRAENCRQFYSAYQMQPYWLQNERPRMSNWSDAGITEINAAKSIQELANLENFLPRENRVMLALEHATWKFRLAEVIEKTKANEEIQKIIQQLAELGYFNEKG